MKKARSNSAGDALDPSGCPILRGYIKYHEAELGKLRALHAKTVTSTDLCDILDVVSIRYGDLGGQWLIAPNQHANEATPLDLLIEGKLSEVRDVLITEYGGSTVDID
jgi:hypothetical protein